MTLRKTTEQFIEQATAKHGDRYDYSLVEYVAAKAKVTIVCRVHGEFEQAPGHHLYGKGCRKCANVAFGARRQSSTGDFIKAATAKHKGVYDYSLVNYVNSTTKVTIICQEHGEFAQGPDDHLQGKGCKACGVIKGAARIRQTTAHFIKLATEKHGDLYDYSLVDYLCNSKKVTIICRVHGEFEQAPCSHYTGARCPDCVNLTRIDSQRKTRAEFIEQASAKHGDLYDYSLVDYLDSKTNVTIICQTHGEFEQRAANHIQGALCPKCSGRFMDTQFFIEKATEKHGRLYDYSQTHYVTNQTKITIVCRVHGEFEQDPNTHLSGSGCPRCGALRTGNFLRTTTPKFIEKARVIHGGKYDYSLVDYVTTAVKVKIICQEHGEFEQAPANHLGGNGCPRCRSTRGNDLLYIHKADGLFYKELQVYKIGVTSQRLPHTSRLKKLERALGTPLANVLYMPVNSCAATDLERKILNRFTIQPDWRGRVFDGSTEYRALTDYQLNLIVESLESRYG